MTNMKVMIRRATPYDQIEYPLTSPLAVTKQMACGCAGA